MGNKKAPWKLVVSMHTSTFSMIAQIRSRPPPVVSTRAFVSGSTAWHGAFRFRQYLRSMKNDRRRATGLVTTEFAGTD